MKFQDVQVSARQSIGPLRSQTEDKRTMPGLGMWKLNTDAVSTGGRSSLGMGAIIRATMVLLWWLLCMAQRGDVLVVEAEAGVSNKVGFIPGCGYRDIKYLSGDRFFIVG